MTIDRRFLLAGAGASAATSLLNPGGARALTGKAFPKGFLWGVAGAGHQVEGNNVNSDIWLLENVRPTMFAARSGDADNSFELWPGDLDMVKSQGLNTFRFSLEWARIEPEKGLFSRAMLDHYKAMIDGCRSRGLLPMVSFNHFTTPRWFAAQGGWTSADAANLFARFCDRAARHLADGISHATTLNEPNTICIIGDVFPKQFLGFLRSMNDAAARACLSQKFTNAMVPDPADIGTMLPNLIAAHKSGKAAIKAVRGDLPVGVTLAISDDQAVGANSLRDEKRRVFYSAWLDAARSDDFLGVQNYERAVWDNTGNVPAAKGVTLNASKREVYAPSLANAVRYAHSVAKVPIMVTEHGVATDDDTIRATFIRESLDDLQKLITDGVPVRGYIHWSLLDSFEWIFGYKLKLGLCAVDSNFKRTPKPSLRVLGEIAARNAI